jgi:IS1 family transposase
MTGAGKNTIARLLVDMGKACAIFHDVKVRNLNALVVQVDEIWSFVGCKEAHARQDQKEEGKGDAWTWVAIDADHKLVITWLVGDRNEDCCRDFIGDLADRLDNRIQLSSDGLGIYNKAVKLAFGANVDYGQIIKVYGEDFAAEKRYSPAICTEIKTKAITGDPMDSLISTSYIERQNLTLRMQSRRFTRLTNAFSKKHENHVHAVALHYTFYNFCRPHQTLTQESGPAGKRYPTTPAMKAGITDHVWTVEELVGLLD